MGEGQGKRSRTANHLPGGVVLGAVARALELVLGLVPRDDAAQVRANSVQPEVREGTILLDDQVRGVTLQALRERVVARQVRLEPFSLLDVVAVRVLSRLTGATAAGAVRSKQFYPSVSSRRARYCSTQSQPRTASRPFRIARSARSFAATRDRRVSTLRPRRPWRHRVRSYRVCFPSAPPLSRGGDGAGRAIHGAASSGCG